jgi:hypothetical protein
MLRIPIRAIGDFCAAKVSAQVHAPAAPPSKVMKSRRLIVCPRAETYPGYQFRRQLSHSCCIGSIATGRGKLQVQPCPQCPVSDGRPKRRPVVMGQKRPWPVSLDHLVGSRQQHLGHRNAKRIRGLEIDPKLELRRLLDRDIGGLDAAEQLDELSG